MKFGFSLVVALMASTASAGAVANIDVGVCDGFALMAGSTTTCDGAPSCVITGELGVSPGTSITGNFKGDNLHLAPHKDDDVCAADGLAAWQAGTAMKDGEAMLAEMGGLTFGPGLHTHGSAINVALANPTVTLDAEDNEDAVFIFQAGSTLTTCANSKFDLVNGAKPENVYWILGTALTMGADSTMVGTVLAGSAITIGTNGKICGKAIAQSAVTCATACAVGSGAESCGDYVLAPQPTEKQVAKAPPKATKGGAYGDPHIKTWNGEHYEYHGACDLVLVHNPDFANGLGMDVHMRNKKVRWWSYIDSAVLRIGDDTLEVKGGESSNEYWINGVLGDANIGEGTNYYHKVGELSGYPIKFKWVGSKNNAANKKRREFQVDLGNGEEVFFSTFKYFVRVSVNAQSEDNFGSAVGLMGSYPSGEKKARDGTTAIEDVNAFGQEWQVGPNEPMLFRSREGPQAPIECKLPVVARRLGESHISMEEAEIACSRVGADDRDACIFDVLATEDKNMAGAY